MSRTTHRGRVLAATGALLALALSGCGQGSATNPTTPADQPTTPVQTATETTTETGTEAAEPTTEPEQTPEEPAGETITYMNFSANGGNEENLDTIAEAFTAETGITVQIQTLPYDDYFTALQTSVAGGTASDAFELNYENFITYAANGVLAPLEGVDAGVFTPSLLEAYQYEGVQYGLPESFSNVVLYYNTDLFDAAGVDYPTAEWTWAEEKAAAEQLTDTEAGVWGDYQPISFHEFYKVLAQSGGEFFTEDGSAAAFNSPEGIEAATWLVEKSGAVMPTEADGVGTPDFDTNLFKEGKLAMWHTGIWMFGALADTEGLNYDIAVEPGNTQKASAMFANGVVVNATSEKQEAAEQWAEWLTGSDIAATTRVEAGWELPPVADQSLVEPYLEISPPANRQAVFDALESVVLPPVIEAQQEMQDAVSEALTEAAAGRMSVEDALAQAEQTVNGLLN